jgi:hypothetical protein
MEGMMSNTIRVVKVIPNPYERGMILKFNSSCIGNSRATLHVQLRWYNENEITGKPTQRFDDEHWEQQWREELGTETGLT